MLETTHGNLLSADADALVNTVNTRGVMGKGVALQFKQAFPANYKAYKRACNKGEVRLGRMFVFHQSSIDLPHYIINFPTKDHWRSKSTLAGIEAGLADLVRVIKELDLTSIAIPPLGCGNGGLEWADVRPLIEAAVEPLTSVAVMLYPPEGAPDALTMPVATVQPRLTYGRAAVLAVLGRYATPGIGLSRLEIQKLAYLLQASGESALKLRFEKAKYGPYAENLQHVLQAMEGHYLRGYGDRTTPSPISLTEAVAPEAEAFLDEYPDTLARLDEVTDLIDGFESPYGLELLTTVHWVAQSNPAARTDPAVAIQEVQAWSGRKRRLFTDKHIGIAWSQLEAHGWLGKDDQSGESLTSAL